MLCTCTNVCCALDHMQSLPVIVCYLNNNNKVQLTCSVKEKQAPHDPSPRLVSTDFLYKFAMKVVFPINKMEVVHVLKVQQIILGRKKFSIHIS